MGRTENAEIIYDYFSSSIAAQQLVFQSQHQKITLRFTSYVKSLFMNCHQVFKEIYRKEYRTVAEIQNENDGLFQSDLHR